MMSQGKIDDPAISRKVSEKLSSSGIRAPCHVTVTSNKAVLKENNMLAVMPNRREELAAMVLELQSNRAVLYGLTKTMDKLPEDCASVVSAEISGSCLAIFCLPSMR